MPLTNRDVRAISASDSVFSTGTVRITGGSNVTVGTDASGLVVSAGGGVQTVQTQSLVRAISASNATFDGTVRITGAGDITVGSDASGAVVSGSQSAQTQSNVQAIVASDATYRTGDVVLTGSNAATVKSAAGQKAVIDVPTQTVQPGVQNLVASDATFSSGTVSVTGAGEGITVNTAASKIQVSGAQTGVKHLVASDNTFSSGTVSITGAGGGATVNTAASKIQVSVAAQSVQPGVQHLVASDNTFSSGTVSVTGAGEGITVNTAASKIQVSGAQTGVKHLVASDNTFSSGTVSITGTGGGVTINTAASKIQVSVASQTAQPVGSLSLSGNTAGTMANLPFASNIALSMAGGGTLSQSSGASSSIVQLSVHTQSVQPVGSLAAAGNTSGTMGTLPLSGSIGLAGGNNVTISQSSGAASTNLSISVPNTTTQTVQTQSNIQLIAASDTTYQTGQVQFTGSNMVTVKSSANQRVVIDATQAPVGSLSLSGNTAGTMANVPFGSNIVLSAAGGATLSQSSGASSSIVQLSVHTSQSVQPGVQNLVASDATFSSGTVTVTGAGNGITVNTAAGKIQISGSQTVQTQSINPKMAFWQVREDAVLSGISHLSAFSKTPIYFPVTIPGDMTLNSIGIRLSNAGTATLQSFSVHFGLYTLANSTSANLLGSGSDSFNNSVSVSTGWSAARDWVMTSPSTVAAISNITAGAYVVGLMFSAGASGSMNMSLVGPTVNATAVAEQGIVLPGNNSVLTVTSQGLNGFYGQGSSTVNGMPSAVSVADLRNQGTATQALLPYMFIRS